MFLSRNKKTNVYPCKPNFYYIKVGFKGSKLYVFVMVPVKANRLDTPGRFSVIFVWGWGGGGGWGGGRGWGRLG